MASDATDLELFKRLQKAFKVKLSKGQSRDVLIKALKGLEPTLGECNQEVVAVLKPDLDSLAQTLVDPFLAKNKSKEVKLLVAICTAEILRLFAPNPPYSDRQLQEIFSTFIEQMGGLGGDQASPAYQRYFYLLESLSRINSCVVLVERELWSTLVRLFRLFFELSEQELAARIEFHMLDILSQCINECQHIPTELLDCILVRLVSSKKEENPKAMQLAMKLLSRCSNALERPVCAFLDETLIRERKEEDLATTILERRDQLSILEQVCIRQPQLLLSLVPSLQDMITSEDENRRVEMAELMTRVFTDPNSTMARKYESVFEVYLARSSDVSPKVRAVVVEACKELLLAFYDQQGKQNKIISETLELRLSDTVDRVRQAAVSSVCEAATKDPRCVSLALLHKVGKRTMDKKDSVRSKALEGLATLFKKHVSVFWKDAKALPPLSKIFVWIPKKIIPCFLVKEMRFEVDSLVNEQLLPNKATAEQRLRCLMGIFSTLDDKCKEWFRTHLKTKHKLQHIVSELLRYTEHLADNADDTSVKKKQQQCAQLIVLTVVPHNSQEHEETGKKVKALIRIAKHKDRNVSKWLKVMCDPSTGFDKLRTVQSELLRVLRLTKAGSKEKDKQMETVAVGLVNRLGLTLISGNSTELLLQMVEENLKAKLLVLSVAGLEILLEVARSFPQLISGAGAMQKLSSLVKCPEPEVYSLALQVLAEADPRASTTLPKKDAKILSKRLRELATAVGDEQGEPAAALSQTKNAIRAIAKAFGKDEADDIFRTLLTDHVKQLKLNSSSKALGVVLQMFSEIARCAPEQFSPHVSHVQTFLFDRLLPSTEDAYLDNRTIGYELLANVLLGSQLEGKEMEVLARPALSFLLRLLEGEGDLTGLDSEIQLSQEELVRRGRQVVGASNALLMLCTNPSFHRMLMFPSSKAVKQSIKVARYHFATLALVAHSENQMVREEFVEHLTHLLREAKLPLFPYASILCLCASDDSANQSKVLASLKQLITKHRNKIGLAQGGVVSGGGEKLPEYLLPDLIYMLAYHPDFDDRPDEEDSQQKQREDATEVYVYFTKILSFLLKALCVGPHNNYTLIMQLTHTVKSHEDVRDANNTVIWKLAELAQLELQKIWQGKDWNGAEHPGEIILDSKMYKPKTKPGLAAYLPEWYRTAVRSASPKKGKQKKIPVSESQAVVSSATHQATHKTKKETKKVSKKEKELKPEPQRTRAKLSRGAKAVNKKDDMSEREFEDLLEVASTPTPKRGKKEIASPYDYPSTAASSKTNGSLKVNGKAEAEEDEEEKEEEIDLVVPGKRKNKTSPTRSAKRQKLPVPEADAIEKVEEEEEWEKKKQIVEPQKSPKKRQTPKKTESRGSPKKTPVRTVPAEPLKKRIGTFQTRLKR
eukprot:gb/GEZN01000461.1/.p1 GENE.gb/GEZN01000461.1/~~gb/GEZN01000461.1/.p1  ORF type:complete len:1392 (+),score=340.63 gb/GEZN01000461.1/:82-4257(+)